MIVFRLAKPSAPKASNMVWPLGISLKNAMPAATTGLFGFTARKALVVTVNRFA